MNSPPPTEHKMGTIMYVLAWGVVFLLLGLFFNEWLDKQQNPNSSPQSQINQRGEIEIILAPNRQHHYLTSGKINGKKVIFLLDTGATDVVIPARLANELALEKGQPRMAHTANGTVKVHATRINKLDIGDISLQDVSASINPGMQGEVILLGMSALRRIEFSQKGDLLILRQ